MSLYMAKPSEITETTPDATPPAKLPLGYVDWDTSTASNERVVMRSPPANRDRIIRDQYVRIEDPLGSRTGFLGRIVEGPFFPNRGPMTNGADISLGKGLSGGVA